MPFKTRVVEPKISLEKYRKRSWEEDGRLLEDWFRDGESIEYDEVLLNKLDDEWERSIIGWRPHQRR